MYSDTNRIEGIFKEKCTHLSAYIRKENRFKSNYLSFHHKGLEKEE